MTQSEPPDDRQSPAGAMPPAGRPAPAAGHLPPAEPAHAHEPAPEPGHVPQDVVVTRSRFGGLWVGLIVAAVILVLLLIFILQNSQTVRVDYFGLSGHLPLAVAILLGVAAGALLVALPGTVRILQLRKSVRRQ